MWSQPAVYWHQVCQLLQAGAEADGLELLTASFRADFPASPILPNNANHGAAPAHQPNQTGTVTAIRIEGVVDPAAMFTVASGLHQGVEGRLEQAYYRNGTLLLNLIGAPTNAGFAFGRRLEAELRLQGNNCQIEVASERYADYLIERIVAEGPDSRRWELLNLPASTPVSTVAQTVMTQYPDAISKDEKGRTRAMVVDSILPDGTTRRLIPQTSLHENGVGNGANLGVHPESTAGMMHPDKRNEALVRVRNEMTAFAERYQGFQVFTHSRDDWPTEYLIEFSARSFGPPAAAGKPPVPIEKHLVRIFLPPEFPITAPEVYWQVPIFHPNIDLKSGKVCLGNLGDRYVPGLDFGELCRTLVDIASYQNYAVESGYNLDAQAWAHSLEGMKTIEERGGRCLLRKMAEGQRPAENLEIRALGS
jgi:hypothetical protein